MTEQEKYEVVLGWLNTDMPIDGGYPNPARLYDTGGPDGEVLILCEMRDGTEPTGISIHRKQDLIRWYDEAAKLAASEDWDLEDAAWEIDWRKGLPSLTD